MTGVVPVTVGAVNEVDHPEPPQALLAAVPPNDTFTRDKDPEATLVPNVAAKGFVP
jgi:hypothetical protein